MRRLRSIAALLGFILVALGADFAAAGERVAPLVPQMRPPVAPELRDRFHEAVARGLQGGSDEIMAAAEVRLRLGNSEEMLSCAGSGACVARSAQALRADKLVATEVDVSGKTYAVKMRLVDAVGRELVKVDEVCDICTVKEVDETVTRAATRLAAAARALPPDTTPPAAKTEPVPPPKAEAPKPEPPPVSKVELEPTPVTPEAVKPAEKKGFPWRPVAIASVAAGVVGLAVGIPLLAIDGQPTCNKPNPQQACPEVYNTKGAGAALLTLGIVAGATSGVLFYMDHRARKKSHTAVLALPIAGGAYVSWGGRF